MTMSQNKWLIASNKPFIKLIKFYLHIKRYQTKNKKYHLSLVLLHFTNNPIQKDSIKVHFP